jgi:uncharacterized membrane protein YesL
MAGIFNSFYYGKAGKADFTPDQLPKNRRQLFFETLRVRFSSLIGMNLLYVFFMLPSLLWTFINSQLVFSMLDAGMDAAGTAQIADAASQTANVMGTVFIYLIGLIPCMAFSGAFKPGIVYILRNWARDQHSFIWSDFKDAVKLNWKCGLLAGLINGFSFFLTYECYLFYGDMAVSGAIFWVIPQTFIIVICAMWWMANMLIFPMMVTYEMKFRQLVRNCFIIVVARLPWSILFFIGALALPAAFLLLGIPYGELIFIALYLLIGFSVTLFAFASYANSCFDRFLNPRIEGASVNIGLRDPVYDDLDDEDEADEDAQ